MLYSIRVMRAFIKFLFIRCQISIAFSDSLSNLFLAAKMPYYLNLPLEPL